MTEKETRRITPAPASAAATRPRQELESGQVLGGRYRIESLLGRGGVGAVYAAVHLQSGRSLAVKVLLPHFARAQDVVARFRREAQAASLLDHPGIIDVFDLGVLEDGTLFLVMDRVEGVSVAELVATGAVGVRRTLVLIRQALDALSYAHTKGLIHRDLKPENLMVVTVAGDESAYEQIKILDFGLVKLVGEAAAEMATANLTRTGTVFGTPGYMPPEQALGRRVDARADLYALGVVLFEMLTGEQPFQSDDSMTLLRLHVSSPAPLLSARATGRPWCTPEMDRLVARALEKKPESRFSSADEMLQALDLAFVSIDHLPFGV